jgi:hypothetical protein
LHDGRSHTKTHDSILSLVHSDIFNFPLVNDRFCDELVAQSEHYGKWSGADKYGGQPTGDERYEKN